MTRRRFLRAAVATLATGTLVTLGATCYEGTSPSPSSVERTRLPVEVMSVVPATSWPRQRVFTGVVRARRTADLSFPDLERLVELVVDEGDVVERDQLLARQDTLELDAQRREVAAQLQAARALLTELQNGPRAQTVDAARAEVDELESLLSLAESSQRRKSELLQKQAVSVERFDAGRFGEAAARARLAAARYHLAELEAGTRVERLQAQQAEIQRLEGTLARLDAQRQDSELRAPFAGTIGRRYLDEGSVPQPGTPVLRLVETSALESVVGVPIDLAQTLAADCRVTLTAGDKQLAAELMSLLPELDETTRTRKVVFRLTDPKPNIAPGQLVRLKMTEPVQLAGFWVPISSLVRGERGLWSVYTVQRDTNEATWIVIRRDVEVLLSEAGRALVRGTLQAGEQVVATGTHRLVNGQLVQIARRNPALDESTIVP